jgi:hypothetical protein
MSCSANLIRTCLCIQYKPSPGLERLGSRICGFLRMRNRGSSENSLQAKFAEFIFQALG